MRVVLTGFDSFTGVESNPSQLIVEHFARRGDPDLVAAVLPTQYDAAAFRIRTLIREHRPDVVLSLGVAQTRTAISLERVALNLDDCDTPDNAGVLTHGRLISPGAPLAYFSTLPLDALLAALKLAAIPAAISNHAGTFVCNHVLYCALHEVALAALPTRCGFVHVPAVADESRPERPGLTLAAMLRAVEVCLGALK
jgi:pyroglutamyl-peptidase